MNPKALYREVPDEFIIRIMIIIVLFLIAVNLLFIFIADKIINVNGIYGNLIKQLDLNKEASFATWISSMLLFLNSLCSYQLARYYQHCHLRTALIYGIFFVGFVFLSIDDFIQFHEHLEFQIKLILDNIGQQGGNHPFLGLWFGGILGIMLLIIISGSFYKVVSRENRIYLLFTIGAIIISLFAEMVYRVIDWSNINRGFRIVVFFEEGAELSAICFFLNFQRRELGNFGARNYTFC